MSSLKSGTTVLVLAVPFVAYAAYQIRLVTRLESDRPSEVAGAEKGLPSAEQLAASRATCERWADDLREAAAVAWQFRPTMPPETISDPDALALVRSAVARSANLTDLEKFLSGADRPVFLGGLKERYAEWQVGKASLARSEAAIEAWLRGRLPDPIDGVAAAERAMRAFAELIADYRRASQFADGRKVDAWQVEARVKVIRELVEAADKPYAAVLALPLPLPPPANNNLVERALAAPAAIREQARGLRDDLSRAAERGSSSNRLQALARETLDLADEWIARERLLTLLTDAELISDPTKAAFWLPRVQALLDQTPTDAGQALIRRKVQQFCDAYIPRAVRLDELVLVQGKPEPRAGVVIEYDSDARAQPLSDRLDGLNEFNFVTAFKNFDRIVWSGGNKYTGMKTALQPTPKSLLARDFTVARAAVTTWSLATINRLKNRCEGSDDTVQQQVRRDWMEELIGIDPGSPGGNIWTKQNTRLWTRLSTLAAGMAKYPALFEFEERP